MSEKKFWKLTWSEWTLRIAGYEQQQRQHDAELASLFAHIANCLTPKKQGHWTWKDFSRFNHITNVPERKLTMKEAKQSLGGKWRIQAA